MRSKTWRELRSLPVRSASFAGRIALSDFGPASGVPTLLFHSAVTGSLLDRGLVRALQAAGMRPIAVDCPGFGNSDPTTFVPKVEDWAKAVPAVLDHLGIKQFMVLGFCIGGPLIWNLIKRAPDRVVAFADRGAVRVLGRPALGQGADVEGRDALRGFVEGLLLRRVEVGGGLLELLERDADLADRQLRVVELRGVVEDRDVAAGLHVGDDGGDGGADVRGGFARADEGAELGAEVLVAGAEEGHGLRRKGSRRCRSGGTD